MDNDLLITNTFIPTITDEQLFMNRDIKRQQLRDYMQPQSQAQTQIQTQTQAHIDEHKYNPILDDEFKAKEIAQRFINKEARKVISINSNQRILTTDSDLTDPAEYKEYVDPNNYQNFEELYNLLKNINRKTLTYQDYINLNGDITFPPPNQNQVVSDMVHRAPSTPAVVDNLNPGLFPFLNKVAVQQYTRADYESMANLLNSYVMSGITFNPKAFWRPFYFTGYVNSPTYPPVRQILYNQQNPNNYSIVLPSIINHVKSIRLIGSEIPNTINNITERNNIITIQLKYTPPQALIPIVVPLDPLETCLNFILVKLDIGTYTMDTLISHMQYKINQACVKTTLKKYADLFTISWDRNTGAVKIVCNRSEVLFHLKFYAHLSGLTTISDPTSNQQTLGKSHGVINYYARDLWFLLGFPWPYEIDSDGLEKYTQLLTNQVSFGIHPVFNKDHPDDLFDRTTVLDIVDNQRNNELFTYRAYKYPDIDVKLIYMVIKGFKAVDNINQFNRLINFKDADIFAKIQISATSGSVCYNTYIDNPLVFLNVYYKIDTLNIMFIDEQGYLVDFNGVDHTFTLEIIHYVTQIDVNRFNTLLGNIDHKSYPDWLAGGN